MFYLAIKRLLCPAALTLMLATSVANAQTTFLSTDTTLDASNPVPVDAIVGYANFDDFLNEVNGTSPTVRLVTGGSVATDLQLFNNSTLNMSDGTVGAGFGNVLAFDNSIVNLSGGNAFLDVQTQGTSTLNFSGGTIGDDIFTFDNTTANMSGGTVSNAILTNFNSTFNLSGGTLPANVFIQDSSLLNVLGTDLSSVLLDPNFEDFYSEYALFGHLQDNTDLNGATIFVQNGDGARFALINGPAAVPEPGSVAFLMGILACGGKLLVRRRKQQARQRRGDYA